MTSQGLRALKWEALLLAVLAAGCGAGAAGGSNKLDAKGSGSGGAMDSGGTLVIINGDAAIRSDGGVGGKGDAGRAEVVQANLSSDAAVFDWDAHTCVGCNTTDKGGDSGPSGSAGTMNPSGGKGAGGALGSGGVSSKGGNMGAGGATTAADAAVDGRTLADAGGASSSDAGVPQSRDAASSPDLGVATEVAAGSSNDGTDSSARCVAQIEALIPATPSLERYPLVAATNAQVVLRAEIVAGGPAAGATWTWQATRDGTPIAMSALGQQDPSAVAFPIAKEGSYTFTALDKTGACLATAHAYPVPANVCNDCDRSVILRASPPATSDIPVQSGAMVLNGSSPYSQTNVVLTRGVAVEVSPSIGSNLVSSYVRISSVLGELVADGLADPRTGGFSAQLLAVDKYRTLLKYDVLVVPLDSSSSNGGTAPASAPQLFQNLTAANISSTSFSLVGGVTVTGTTKSSSGAAVGDVRVMLTNQDPTLASQSSDLLFSSVGRSDDSQGSFSLHVQPGTYWVSLSPPDESGLAEALAPLAVTLTGDTSLDFKWNTPSTSTLVLNVADAAGAPSSGTRVRLTSADSKTVGTLTVGTLGQSANGNTQVEGTTSSAGVVTFTNLPDNMTYSALLVPALLGPYAATTTLALNVPAGGATESVRLLAQGRLNGRLVASALGAAAVDWTRVNLIAYDRSNDTPESPLVVTANSDGTFSLGASPGRPYVVLAVPDVSTGLARTFVGPGLLQTSEFAITQNVQAAMSWTATVMDESQNGLSGTALQVFCDVSWPNCIDATIALAETTSDDSGTFQLALPDPATR